MENLKMLKDGNRLIIVIDEVLPETESFVENFISNYTLKKLEINKISNVKEDNIVSQDVLTEIKEITKKETEITEISNKNNFILKKGKYKGKTIEEALKQSHDVALREIIDISSEYLTECKRVIKIEFEKIGNISDFVAKLTNEKKVLFLNLYTPLFNRKIEDAKQMAKVKTNEELIEKVDTLVINTLIINLIENYILN